ncbi:MAG: hypothetical protein LBT46_08750 [Planctomycetaceae bacterium]|jgi:hypothetical protein|nr:hypothetical protein [Planctomycetaceae bacterium]
MPKNKVKFVSICLFVLLAVSLVWMYRWELSRSFSDGDGLYITPKTLNLGKCEPDAEIKVSFRITNLTSE